MVLPCVQRGLRQIDSEVEGLSLSGTTERSVTFLDHGDTVRVNTDRGIRKIRVRILLSLSSWVSLGKPFDFSEK